MNILVTGGCGFIGSHLVRALAQMGIHGIRVLDTMTYAAAPGTIAKLMYLPGVEVRNGDICDPRAVDAAMEDIHLVYHLAAESHVDRSIADAAPFVRTNVLGTQVLLDAARSHGVSRFLYVSTDEVMGSLGPDDPPFSEQTPLAPRSPYSASKAAGEHLVNAYHETHGLATLITRCSNNYGPYQFPEKLIPLLITRLLGGQKIPIYGDGQQVRDWLHVEDHCTALMTVMECGRPGRTYCIGGNAERTNMKVAAVILKILGQGPERIEHVTDRPGHDRRYAIDASRIGRELGWFPWIDFEWGLIETVRWYQEHRDWWEPLLGSQGRG